MKGPSEKGELFAVLEYMKGGQVVKGIFKGIFKWCACAVVPHGVSSQEGFPSRTFVGFSCFIACANLHYL